jgi:hypothetical protein
MSYRTNSDNLYKEGTIIRAKSDPALKLIIMKYYHRTYYCSVMSDPAGKQLTYFERDLIPPTAADRQ